ncbi:winged helix-turn-helix domain-containing protein [Pseudoalteromonas obscura]|uniref:Winged helix-turn-helix domain-containing protein n=1 Tax=Pseudoalteromonas obscura TaxID=3048491 RepID=A0ABT7EP82_9GAMM|nr:winged helix-turn-helix domain-containing protein [Pseudoalteromonas sp. P94(2023)]MDK2596866.1 winged helix-turn-helix domain-containing protein [Pseudoalteromonas sp. P94(2023)]
MIINERSIDTSRNQITYQDHHLILPPKVIAVLSCLAKRQGQVVSHDEMVDEVWKHVVVSSNSLQRAIAELRKALGDDGKSQSIIKTHSKQGYSLEVPVLWCDRQTQSTDVAHRHAKKATKPELLLVFACIMISLIGVFYFAKQQEEAAEFTQLTSLTASDVQEGAGLFSPDGKYLVFYRHLESCKSELWAKDLANEQSIKLTLSGAKFSGFTFSPDGKKLGFLQNRACEKVSIEYDDTVENCWDLVAIDFAEALKKPQTPHALKACKSTRMYHPQWLTSDSFATLDMQNNLLRVAIHNTSNHQVDTLFEDKNLHLYVLRYSATHQLLAVIGLDKEGGQVLSLLKPSGELVAQNIIDFPSSFDSRTRIYPNFDPDSQRLLYGSGKALFELSFDGSVKPIILPLHQDIYSINVHPRTNAIVGTYGTYDSDLVSASFEHEQVSNVFTSQSRSTRREHGGQFSPDEKYLAFISARNGSDQVWLSGGTQPKRITQFKGPERVLALQWLQTSKGIIIATNQALYQYDLSSQRRVLVSDKNIEGLYRSKLFTHSFFAYQEHGETHLATISFEGKFEVLLKTAVRDAVLLKPQSLIYQDLKGHFWRVEQGQVVALSVLNQHAHKAQFIERDGFLYGLSSANWLWRYDIEHARYQQLKKLDANILSIADVGDSQLLFEKLISQQKEIVMIE